MWGGRLRWPRYSLAGSACALVFGCLSFTPSLLPREWWIQSLVVGFTAAFGYAIGVFLAWVVGSVVGRRLPAPVVRGLWLALAAVSVPLLAFTLWRGQRWQTELHRLMGERPPDSYAWVRILLLALVIFLAAVGAGRGLRRLVRRIAGWMRRRLPARLFRPVAALVIVLGLIGLNDGLVWDVLAESANSTFSLVNSATKPGTNRPTAAERSGSPASLVRWGTLGRQGRDFVASGPTRAELAAFSGSPARTPVRVYAGLESAPTTAQRAALAVRELRRAGGFSRAVLVVVTTTGTGLVEEADADAVEYMYNGDSAMVAVQYSYLPSWLSVLADPKKAQEAGRELFNQVYDAWSALPVRSRPKLLVTGTSLGAFGGEAAFSGLQDIRHRTDGVVWAGPPNASILHGEFVAERDPRSPEWLPVVDSGRSVRFASAPSDLARPSPAGRPDVVYLQNGSDPIVFWSPQLLFDRPDWLSEPAARDVSPDMFWMPVVTFWQVTADLPLALNAPPGHGHDYREIFADAWAAVAPPAGWSAGDTARLRARLAELVPSGSR